METRPPADIVSIFVHEATQRFADMEVALAALETNPADAEALEQLARRFHSFAGVAGLDGFEIINALGARGENDCRRTQEEGSKVSPEQLRRWRSILEVMQSETEEMQAGAVEVEVPLSTGPRRIYDVLLVEDDREIHASLIPQLEEEGFNVTSAYSMAEALECLVVQRPHALLVDLTLGDGSGYEVIEHFRSMEGQESAAVVIISRRGDFLDRMEGIRLGADAYFSKPFDAGNLVRRLRALVQSRDASVARILSVEDDLEQAAYVRSVLESAGYEVRTCSDPKKFESEMATFGPDLVLMDILLPEVSGYELARFARQNEEYQTTPILFLTTEGQLHTRIQSMRSGGDDHIVKPVTPALLLAAVETRIARARQLRQFLDRDSLTGLLNRGAFLRQMKTHLRRAADVPASLVMLDVDRFKGINDTYGHGFGDQVLCRLASFLRTHVRVSDAVCRYGGEELTMLIDDVTEDEAVRLVDRLREDFAKVGHVTPAGKLVYVTFSAGVAALPGQLSAMTRAIEAADAALYRAKAAGRNCVLGATPRFPVRISA